MLFNLTFQRTDLLFQHLTAGGFRLFLSFLFQLLRCRSRDGLLFLDGAVFFIPAREVTDMSVFQFPDARGEFVDKIPVVGDEDERALIILQRILQPFARVDIQMVRWLVEDPAN